MTKSAIKLAIGGILTSICLILPSCSSNDDIYLPGSNDDKPLPEASGYTDRMAIPLKELTCHTGGEGHKDCKIEPGIKIGDFLSIGCGVVCYEGYYACCGVRCVCKPIE